MLIFFRTLCNFFFQQASGINESDIAAEDDSAVLGEDEPIGDVSTDIKLSFYYSILVLDCT